MYCYSVLLGALVTLLYATAVVWALPAAPDQPTVRAASEANLMESDMETDPAVKRNHEVTDLKKQISELKNTLRVTQSSLEDLKKKITHLSRQSHHRISLKRSCRTLRTNYHETVGKTLEYLDNFDIRCHHGEYLSSWRMTWGRHGKNKAIYFVCCQVHAR